jgi:hypothetical protein
MKNCRRCGAALSSGHQFCAACGFAIEAAPTPTQPTYAAPPGPPGPTGPPPGYTQPTYAAPPTQPGPPPGYGPPRGTPPAYAPGAPQRPNVDLSWVIRGNWIGALATALVGLVVALGVSTALIFWSNPPHTSFHDKMTIAVMSTAATVSADTVGEFSFDLLDEEIEGEGSVQTVPLFITLLSLGGAAFTFRRVTRGYPRVLPAIADAGRAAAIFALGLWILALTVRGGAGSLTEAMDIDSDDVGDAMWGASAVGALFLGFGLLLAVLLLTLLLRADWLSPRWSRVSAIVAAPLVGFALFVAVLPVAGAVSYATVIFTADKDVSDEVESDGGDGADVAAFMTGSVSNWGLHYLSLGAGGRVGYAGDASELDEGKKSEWHRLASTAEEMDDAWGMWFAIPVLALVLLGTTLVVALQARARGTGLAGLAVWAAGLFVLVPLLSRWASLSGSMEISGDGETFGSDGYAGIKGSDSLFIPLLALVVTVVVGLLTGAIDPKKLAALQSGPAPAGGWPPAPQPEAWSPAPQPVPAASQPQAWSPQPAMESPQAWSPQPPVADEAPTQWRPTDQPPPA